MHKKIKHYIVLAFMTIALCFACFNIKAEAKKDVVIVIDPGHGGDNLGARHNGVVEKEANMRVALSMKKELEKYDGVVVYLTRTGDDTMELLDRAKFARDVKADIIISLHFNMSELHDLNGSEMWISSQGSLYTEALKFAQVEQMLLEDYGIPKRGCFTRLNDLGSDYYGIIRESANFGIPAVIVEHCYLDRPEEYGFYDTDAALERLGIIDATAIAMTYRLSSEKLGVDYSRHYIFQTKLPENLLAEDITPPDTVDLDLGYFNEETQLLDLHLSVDDSESNMTHYQYSLNGGETFSRLFPIYESSEIDFKMTVRPMENSGFMVRAYNAYGLYTDSEIYDTNLLLYGISDEPEIKDDMIVIGFLSNLLVEIEQLTQDLPTEVQVAAKFVLIFGSVLGLITIIFLFVEHRKTRKTATLSSEAKGA